MLAAGVLGSAHPLGDCDSLKAALKQVKLHGDEVLVAIVATFTLREELLLEVGILYMDAYSGPKARPCLEPLCRTPRVHCG